MYCWSGLASGNRFCITLERTTGLVLLEEKDGVSESSIDWLNLGQLFNFSNPHHKGLSWEWPTLNHKTKYYETISFQSSHQRSVSILQITWSQAKKWVITHIFWERALTWAHQWKKMPPSHHGKLALYWVPKNVQSLLWRECGFSMETEFGAQ